VIVGSLLLILVAVALLVLGLANGSSGLLVSSIAASLLAAVALVVGARQAVAGRTAAEETDAAAHVIAAARTARSSSPRRWSRRGPRVGEPVLRRAPDDPAGAAGSSVGFAGTTTDFAVPAVTVPAQGGRMPPGGDSIPFDRDGDVWRPPAERPGAADVVDENDADDWADDPPDEPASQHVTPADAARLALLASEVVVVDGRPRYHLADCVHLIGREFEALPVSEAVELGFTPCGRCEPADRLLAGAQAAERHGDAAG
jgi:hypothetical protein